MLSSNDIAQMFAAQQTQFGQSNFYAQTIGISNPAMSLGAYGGSPYGGFQPAGAGVPGMHAPPPVFNYGFNGLTGPGYGSGNRVAANVMGGLSGLATAGGIGLGLAGAFGPSAFRAAAPLFDPISGFLAAGPRIPFLNPAGAGTVMSGLAGAVPGAAVVGAAAMYGGAFFHGAHQQGQIANQLGGFGFSNPLSRTGVGFTRQDAGDIGGAIRQLAHVPEMLTSVEELTRLLPRMRQAGVMQGVRDAAEFNRRFKETVTTIRDMSKILGTTMEEAATFFEQSRSMGFTSRQAQLQNAMNAQFTSGFTGMSMGGVMQMQAGGAQIARQFGARGAAGARGVTNLAQRIQAGIESGAIEEGTLADVTGGVEGAEGIGIAAQKMYGMAQGLSSTPMGTVMMLGAMKRDASGRIVLDKDIIARVARGELSADALKARGSRLSENDKISFMYRAKELGGELAGSADFSRFMTGLVGHKGDDASRLMLQRYTGGSAQDIEMMFGMSGGSAGVDLQNSQLINAREQNIRDRVDPAQIWKRAKTKMAGAMGLHAVGEAGARISNAIGKAYDEFIDDLVGRHVVTLSKEGATAFERAMSGGSQRDVKELFETAHGLRPGGSTGDSLGRRMLAGSFGLVGLGVNAALRPDSGFMNWLRSSDTTTGRTIEGQRAYVEGLAGSSGRVFETLMGAADKGRFVTEEGRAASAALEGIKTKLAQTSKFADADQGKRLELLRESLAGEIGMGLAQFTNPETGMNQHDIARSLLAGDTARVEQELGMSLESAAGQMQDGPAKRLLMAAVSAKKRGVPIDDFLTGGIAATEQADDMLRVKLGEAGGASEAVARNATVMGAQQMRRAAESALSGSGLTGESQAIIRNNANIRQLVGKWSGDPAAKADIEYVLSGRMAPDAAAEYLNKKYGLKLSAKDAEAAMGVIKEGATKGGAKLGDVSRQFEEARIAGDAAVIKGRAIDAAEQVRAAAAALGDTDEGRKASAFAESLSAFGSGKAFDEQGLRAIQGGMSGLVTHYKALLKKNPKKAQEFLASLGPVGAAISNAAGAADRVGATVTREELKQMGLSDAGIQAIMGDAQGSVTVTDTIRQKITSAVAGSGVARTIVGGAGAAEVGGMDSQMLRALATIQTNAEQQTTILAAMLSGKKGDEAQAIADQALTKIRANAG